MFQFERASGIYILAKIINKKQFKDNKQYLSRKMVHFFRKPLRLIFTLLSIKLFNYDLTRNIN